MIRELDLEIAANMEKLSKVDFTKPDGALVATGHQHTIKGLTRALELVLEIANFEEKSDE